MMFSRKQLVYLIVPLIVEQVFLGTIGIADMLMVAPVGEVAISGISLVNSINMLFHSVFSALAAGGSILCIQYLGKGDDRNANSVAKQLLILSVTLAVILGLCCCLGNQFLLKSIFGNAEPQVLKEAVTYFYLSALAYPCIMLFDSCSALFRGMGESRISLAGSVVTCLTNIVLNAALIYGMGWGVFGAGLASLLAKGIGGGFLLICLGTGGRSVGLRKFAGLPRESFIVRNIMRLAVPMALEDGIFHVGKLLVQGVVTSYGTTAIAANAVALTVADFIQMPAYAVGLGMTTVVGQCIGAERKKEAQFYASHILFVSFLLEAGLAVAAYVWSGQITGFYRLTEETAAVARQLICFHSLICGVTWVFAFNIPCVLKASSDVNFVLGISIFSMWTFRVGCSYLFREFLTVGVLGVWMAMGLDWAFRGMIFYLRMRSGKWMEKKFI